jgi:hypothetical protein
VAYLPNMKNDAADMAKVLRQYFSFPRSVEIRKNLQNQNII